MLTRQEEDQLRYAAEELREEHADSPEYLKIAQQLEQAADSGDTLLAAEAASRFITRTSGEPPIKPRRRFICG